VLRQTYDYTATRPVLRANDEGRIFVAGGARRMTASDIPTALPGDSTNTATEPQPPASKPEEARPNKDAKAEQK
jgi:hypothetical protein